MSVKAQSSIEKKEVLVMLTSIETITRSETPEAEEASFRIKRAVYTPRKEKDGDAKPLRKAKKYFDYIQRLGIFDQYSLTGRVLRQDLAPSSNLYLECAEARDPGCYAHFSVTSTERSLNRALRVFSAEPSQPACTITGMCLFGKGVDAAVTSTGRRISIVRIGGTQDMAIGSEAEQLVDIEIAPYFSLYEAEKILRMSRIIENIRQSKGSGYCETCLVTPRVQYYLYLMPSYNQRRLPAQVYLKWILAVQHRELLVRRAFGRRVRGNFTVLPSRLHLLEDYILTQISLGRTVSLDHCLHLLGEGCEIWRAILRAFAPSTWKGLVNLSYVASFAGYAQSALQRGLIPIHVDDAVERVILSETARIKRGVGEPGRGWGALIGLYSIQDVIAPGREIDSDLYYMQRTREGLREVISRTRRQTSTA